MQKGFIIILILAILIGIFAISNSAVVTIDFIFTKVLLSQAIVIFICVLLGALLAIVFGLMRQLALKKEIKELKHKNKTIQIEVDQLKLGASDLTVKLNRKEEELNLLNSADDNIVIESNELADNDEILDTNEPESDDISKY